MLPPTAWRSKRLVGLLAALAAQLAPAGAMPPATPAESVAQLLRELKATGVNVLYSSDLVPPALRVPIDQPNLPPLARTIAALAACGLQLKVIDDRHFIVTRGAPAQRDTGGPPERTDSRSAGSAPMLDEIVVFASHYTFVSDLGGDPSTLSTRDIEQVAGTQNDALRAVRTAPGVATTYSPRPYIRGGNADDVLIRFDDITLTNPFHFRSFQSLISPFIPAAVARIDVYSGGFPARFGTRSAGVIDVAPTRLSSGSELRADLSQIGLDVSSAGQSSRWPLEWLATARRSGSDSSVLQPVDANPGDPTFVDALGRVRWLASGDASATLGWLLLDDRARARANARDELAAAHTRDAYAWLAWDWAPAGALQSHSSVAYSMSQNSHYGSLNMLGLAAGTLLEHHDFDTLALRTEWTYVPNGLWNWNFGAELGVEHANLAYLQNETFAGLLAPSFMTPATLAVNFAQAPSARTLGSFVSARKAWGALETELGLRLDSEDYRDFGTHTQLTPRLNVRYDLAGGWRVYGSWGEFSQAQRVDEFRSEENQLRPDVASRATHAVTGVAREGDGATSWRAELYDDRWSSVSPYYDNVLGLVTLLPELQPDRIRIAPLGARSEGIELSTRHALGKQLNLWGTYTLSRAYDVLATGDVARSWDQRQAANFGVAWAHSSLSASLLVGWHSGWPRTSLKLVTGPLASADYLALGTRNGLRWGDYLSADVHLARSMSLRYGEFSVWLDAINVTNRANACCTEFEPTAPGAAVPGWANDSWQGRSVNLGLTWRWHRDP